MALDSLGVGSTLTQMLEDGQDAPVTVRHVHEAELGEDAADVSLDGLGAQH
jgi:hypothetical protein